MPKKTISDATVADAFLQLLADRGVEYLFANGGTDFAPILESYVKAATTGARVPKPITVPHENVAVSMAMGYWMVTGRMQAMMLHVNVGTANALNILLNASRGNVPILFAAGRSPLTESGEQGGRNLFIHWTQEMFDQAGMLREIVKWDYELRMPQQIQTVVDRAISVANAEPKGPVYLSLPREVLAASLSEFSYESPSRQGRPTSPFPDTAALEQAASWIAGAKAPLLITSSLGFDHDAIQALSGLAERYAIPVVEFGRRTVSLPSNHPMHSGYDPHPLMKEADAIIVVDSIVPWIPETLRPRPDAKVIHIGPDPLHQRIPLRGFECDLAITGVASACLQGLDLALTEYKDRVADRIEERRKRVLTMRSEQEAKHQSFLEAVKSLSPIHPAWLTHCIGKAKGEDAIVMREAPALSFPHMPFDAKSSLYAGNAGGGLGWGLGAAVGAKLAAPDRLVIAAEGDGAYMFCTPVAAHYVALEHDAPFLTVIYDNRSWNEVRNAALHVYPDGYAAKSNNAEPLTHFDHRLQLEKVVESVGGHGARVADPAALPDALEQAVGMVQEDRRQVVLDVVCSN